MNGLKVEQGAWEEICTYLMAEILLKRHNATIRHENFGGRGHGQFGIDLVCNHPDYAGIVGQCKHKEEGKALTWSVIETDLKKTDKYDSPITHYYVLTTCQTHPDVHLGLRKCDSKYTRPNGETFEIKVFRWDKIENLSFIPQYKLREFFPLASRMADYLNTPPDYREFAASVEVMQRVIGSRITQDHIFDIREECLMDGFIVEAVFQPFRELNWDLAKALHGIRQPSLYLFNSGTRELAMCFPAAHLFSRALRGFCETVSNFTIGENFRLGNPPIPTEVLVFNDKGDAYRRKVSSEIHLAAKLLRGRYYSDVLGIDS